VESALRGSAPAGLRLIETFRWEPGAGFVRLPAHLARMAAAAALLGTRFDRAAAERALAGVAGEGALRVRLTLGLDGGAAVETAPLGPVRAVWVVGLAAARLFSGDPWLAVKSTRRPLHDAARAALPAGVDEAVFLNERGEAAEGTVTNVFLDLGDGLATPPLASGALPGVLRGELIASGDCREAVIAGSDLRRGRLFVGNSLRGLIPARLVEA
jgi:4-amino-4-deoxychorismate lyase